MKSSERAAKPKLASNLIQKKDFKVQIIVNNILASVVADTGARVSVCGTVQAKKWNLLHKISKSSTKLKPYQSQPIPVYGIARCAVSFGMTSVPVEWHIISGSCEPILSGDKALQLGIIQFTPKADVFEPILMVDRQLQEDAQEAMQKILSEFPQNFSGLGKLHKHQVQLHIDPTVKPVNVPPRTVPYHLKERVDRVINEMIENDVIEEHPTNEPAPWISCATIALKSNGDIRVTLDARNVNKAIKSTNLPIPRQEDIKAKLAGAKYFLRWTSNQLFGNLNFILSHV